MSTLRFLSRRVKIEIALPGCLALSPPTPTKCGVGVCSFETLITAPRTELHGSLDTDAQGLEFLPDDSLRHRSAGFCVQQTHTAILRERKGAKTHTLATIKGSEGTDRGSEAICSPPHNHESLALLLLGHSAHSHVRKSHVSVTPVTKMRVLLRRSPAGTT